MSNKTRSSESRVQGRGPDRGPDQRPRKNQRSQLSLENLTACANFKGANVGGGGGKILALDGDSGSPIHWIYWKHKRFTHLEQIFINTLTLLLPDHSRVQ